MMSDDQAGRASLSSLKDGSTDSSAVEDYYDAWAETYDATLVEWAYQAPADAAALLAPQLKPKAKVLDVGCGTGLFADALHERGFWHIDGIDISEASLLLAERRGGYDRLVRHDLQELPLPVEDRFYDAAACIGVLTYIESADALLRDMCRCVRSGGMVVFTQRTDRWEVLDFATLVARLEREGVWTALHVSEPRPYLPRNTDFADAIKVIHALCRVT